MIIAGFDKQALSELTFLWNIIFVYTQYDRFINLYCEQQDRIAAEDI